MIEKLASAIYNDIMSGLVGINANPTISLEQLQDDVVDEWMQIIKEYSLKDLIPVKDLVVSINCIDVDCLSLDRCPCTKEDISKPELHFEIPQIINDLAEDSISYIGSIDRRQNYKVYTTTDFVYHKHRRRGGDKPYVYIETTPNSNNMYDGWIFNAPFTKTLSIIAIFKDLRQLSNFTCCGEETTENLSFISAEVKKRLTEKKIRYYRQLYLSAQPNNQVPK